MTGDFFDGFLLPSMLYIFAGVFFLCCQHWFKNVRQAKPIILKREFFSSYQQLPFIQKVIGSVPTLAGPLAGIYLCEHLPLRAVAYSLSISVFFFIYVILSFVLAKMIFLKALRIFLLAIGGGIVTLMAVWSYIETDARILAIPMLIACAISSLLLWIVFSYILISKQVFVPENSK
jgi:fatty acid desaturase